MLGSSGSVSANTWKTIDVTSFITGNGVFNLAVTTNSSTAISLASREVGSEFATTDHRNRRWIRPDCHFHSDTNRSSNLNGYTDAYAHRHPNDRSFSHTDAYTARHSHTDPNKHPGAYSDTYANGDR